MGRLSPIFFSLRTAKSKMLIDLTSDEDSAFGQFLLESALDWQDSNPFPRYGSDEVTRYASYSLSWGRVSHPVSYRALLTRFCTHVQ